MSEHEVKLSKQDIIAATKVIHTLKAQNIDLTQRNAFLRERPDLPVDRIPAYIRMQIKIKELITHTEELEDLLERLVKHCAIIGLELSESSDCVDASTESFVSLPDNLQTMINLSGERIDNG